MISFFGCESSFDFALDSLESAFKSPLDSLVVSAFSLPFFALSKSAMSSSSSNISFAFGVAPFLNRSGAPLSVKICEICWDYRAIAIDYKRI